jgi:glycosyltransferase involved in cell wall biosynthesis
MKVQLLARPDHALFLYKYLKNLVTIKMANFNVTKKGSLIHKLQPKTKLVDDEVVVLNDLTLVNQVLFSLAKLGLRDPFRWESLYAEFAFALRARKFTPDIIHYWPIYCYRYAAQQKTKRNIATVADVYSAHSAHVLDFLKPEYEKFNLNINESYFAIALERDHRFLNYETNIITTSSYVRDSFADFSFGKNIYIAEYGFLGNKDVINNYNHGLIKQESSNSSTLKLIYVGTISVEKGVHYLLEAIKKLNFSFVQLDLIGSVKSGQEKVFRTFLNKKGINFLGHKSNSEVKSILPNYSVLIQPSLSDAYSISVVEALEHALPVIVTENTGIKDSIVKYETGEVVTTANSEAIVSSIEKMLKKEYRVMLAQNIQKFIRADLEYPYPLKVLDIYKNILQLNK